MDHPMSRWSRAVCWSRSGCATAVALSAMAVVLSVAPAFGQDTAGLKTRPGRRPVRLWPPTEDQKAARRVRQAVTLGDWTYRAAKSPSPRGGVPWELIVTPAVENREGWRRGASAWPTLRVAATTVANRVNESKKDPDALPVVVIPDVLWKQRMAADLQDVVGIHFHELVTDDVARILYTVHKEPPDMPGGKPLAGALDTNDANIVLLSVYAGPPGTHADRRAAPNRAHDPSGTRIEATLLAPLRFNLDQTVVARRDPLNPALADSRARHEAGHAQVSNDVFFQVLRGPQDWNPRARTGRRSRLAYYWKREQIGRSWDGYQDGIGKLLTLRTSVVVVPPTRWSILLPIPPERVTQAQIRAFNDAIVRVSPQFAQVDHLAQQRFHARHGPFERAAAP